MSFGEWPDVGALWNDGYALITESQPDVAVPLLGAVAYSRSLPPFPGVVYVTGAPVSGKSTLARQMVDFLEPDEWHGNLAAPEGPDLPREPVFIDNVSTRLNPSARILSRLRTAIDSHLHTPDRRLLVLAGDPVSYQEVDDYLWRLTIRQPIPLPVVRESSRPWGRGARRRLGSAFADWATQQDRDALYDEYLSTWPDEHNPLSSNPAAELASAFGLDLLRRFLGENGSAISIPEHRGTPERSSDFALDAPPQGVVELRDRLLEAIRDRRVQLEGANQDALSAIPLVGRVDGDRILLIPKLTVPLLFPDGVSIAALGAELEGCGLLHRTASNTRTTVARIQGRSTRVWAISASLFKETELAPDSSTEPAATHS